MHSSSSPDATGSASWRGSTGAAHRGGPAAGSRSSTPGPQRSRAVRAGPAGWGRGGRPGSRSPGRGPPPAGPRAPRG
ncbi:hypothetical protein DBP15_28965 [Streptomyces sp. CS065A]|nr:hypothetical protein DBP15_28965 [Streptomyces sp. CS065A]